LILRRLLLLLTVLGLCGVAARAQDNLVENPGFEGAAVKDGLPDGGWWLAPSSGETTVTVDRAVSHQGHASVRFESKDPEKCVLVSRKFAVAPGDDLKFEVWVRGANIPPDKQHAYAGLVFRSADSKIVARHYFQSEPLGGDWSRIYGVAQAPVDAATAEVHLGYTNGPGTVWYDDVAASVTNIFSLSLAGAPKPWAGAQTLRLRVGNRQQTAFSGSVVTRIGKKETSVPVALNAKSIGDFQVPITVSGIGQRAYKIALLDRSGNAVRTIQGKFKTVPALTLYPACPCYLTTGEGAADVLIDMLVNLAPEARARLEWMGSVTSADGRQIQSGKGKASAEDFTEWRVSLPRTTAGIFTVNITIHDETGQVVGDASTDVRVVSAEESQVKVGRDGYVRVAGNAEFPIGLYNSGHDAEMGRAGFNAVHNYDVAAGAAAEKINSKDPELKRLLDEAWTNGLRMMVELPREAIEKGEWAQVSRRIETFKNHPGLFCWGSEERVARGLAKPANIAALYALVQKLDPNHPLVLGDTRDVIEKLQVDRRDFFPDDSMDVGIWWWYPIPVQPGKGNALEGREATGDLMEPPRWLTTTHSKKPLWIAIQAYQKPKKGARFPTPAEYRCQAYLSIINGVKGLFFYTGSGQRDYEGKPSGLLNKPELGHWDYVKQLVGELRDFSPVIMSPKSAEKIELTPQNAPVEFTTRERDGKIYLIAANESDKDQTVVWRSEFLKKSPPKALFENHVVRANGDAFQDNFAPYGVHVYELSE
jgi:hypothetical protein